MAERWYLATIRHGETDYNKQSRYAGTLDIPINDAGREDARRAMEQIQRLNFDVSVVSPLRRAEETARILTGGSLEIVACEHAMERNFGVLQGRTSADVENVRPPIRFIKVGNDYHSLDIPGGETFEELRTRAERFHRHMIDNYRGRRVLVVSHGVFLQQYHGVLRGLDWIDSLGSHVGNLELTIFHMNGDRVESEERRCIMEREQCEF